MLEVMWRARVGDDVFDEDPTVNELQHFAADMFGMESSLFCPSGTMTNQIAIKVHTQPGDEVICEAEAHIHYYEGGGVAFNSGSTTRPIDGNRGVFTADHLKDALRPSNIHFPRTSLVSIENTCNRGGGKVFVFDKILAIKEICKQHNLKLHLDGARLFNAIHKEGTSPKEFGRTFDTISICLSKGLGAPIGSLLIGSKTSIQQAKRIRKVFGGGMRQAGYMAAAGLFALKNNINRLENDHKLASEIGKHLILMSYVEKVLEPETNMVVFKLSKEVETKAFLEHLTKHQILAFEVGEKTVRFVTHLGLPQDALVKVQKALSDFKSN